MLAWKQLAKAYMKNAKIAEDGSSVKLLTLKWIRVTNTDPDAFYVKDHLSEDQLFKRFTVRRGVRFGLYNADDPTPSQLAEDADDILFSRILANEHHVLKPLLPNKRSHGYSLRPRRHNLSIAMKDDDRNFIIRQLFKDFLLMYSSLLGLIFYFHIYV